MKPQNPLPAVRQPGETGSVERHEIRREDPLPSAAECASATNFDGGESNSIHLKLLRIIDAASNRAAEGFRVVEDYTRYVLDDLHLTSQLKDLRHELTAVLKPFAATDRLVARDAQADVGLQTDTPSEFERSNVAAVVGASFARIEQALRSLEEYAKLFDPAAAAQIEQLRYRAYTLERALGITAISLERLAKARLYVLIDGRPSVADFRKLVESLVAAGVHILQLREKAFDDRTLLSRAKLLREITRGTDTLAIVNDRPDLALLSDADGVHVGQVELSVRDARVIVGPRRLIGVSTHSIEQARQAVLDGANYLGLGPTFPSGTKSFDAFPGLDFIRIASAEIALPSFAIGGINSENIEQVLAAGATRIAVSGSIVCAMDPAIAATSLLRRVDSRHSSHSDSASISVTSL